MKNKNYVLFFAVFTIFLINGCEHNKTSKTVTDVTKPITTTSISEADDSSPLTETDLTIYTGVWTENGISREDIVQNGGSYINLNADSSKSLSGIYYCIQPSTLRIATVSFAGLTAENTYTYSYEDDGFDNSGTLQLTLGDDFIKVTISSAAGTSNSSGWSLKSSLLTNSDSTDAESDRSDQSSAVSVTTDSETSDPETTDSGATESGRSDSALNTVLNNYLESVGRTDVPFAEEIFDSANHYYTSAELKPLSKDMLSIFRNEIYARHGQVFASDSLTTFFQQFTWYQGDGFDSSELNECETANLDLVVEVETQAGYR